MKTSTGRYAGRPRRAFVVLAALAGLGAVAAAPSGADTSSKVGLFVTLPTGVSRGLHIDGAVVLQRTDAGTSGVVALRGLVPGALYAAHLHLETCALGQGHYKDNVSGPAAPPNELWFSSTADPAAGITAYPGGQGVGRGAVPWVARPEAKSVVIHAVDPGGNTGGGPRVACADLR